MAWMAVAGCWRGASVALGEVSSLAAVGAHWPVVAGCAEGCWHVSKCMAQGGHLVWPGGPRARVVLLCRSPWATASEGL